MRPACIGVCIRPVAPRCRCSHHVLPLMRQRVYTRCRRACCRPSDSGYSLGAWEIERTADAASTPLQHMGIAHRCTDIFVSEQFLDRADVIPIFQEMGRKTMSERISTLLIMRR
jgi:hypothetical protein